MSRSGWPPISPLRAGLLARCPRCGRGRMFQGLLTVAPRCAVCGLDLSRHDSGDGPAALVILVVGFVVVGAALVVEVKYQPPIWVHMLLWTPAVVGLGLWLLRAMKGVLIALEYRHGELGSDE